MILITVVCSHSVLHDHTLDEEYIVNKRGFVLRRAKIRVFKFKKILKKKAFLVDYEAKY